MDGQQGHGRGARGRGRGRPPQQQSQQQPQRPGQQQWPPAPGQQPPRAAPGQQPPRAASGQQPPRAAAGQPQYQSRSGPPPGQQPPQQLQGVWSRGPIPAAAAPPPTAAAPAPVVASPHVSAGRGVGAMTEEGAVAEGGSGAPSGARGGGNAVRGRTIGRFEALMLHTKPKSCQSKKGTTGRAVRCQANFLPLKRTPKWCLHQYRVDFSPELDLTRTRRFLVKQAVKSSNLMKDYLFDGTVLYTTHHMPEPKELFVEDGETKYRITIRRVGELQFGDHHYLQVFNIIMKNCLRMMGYQLVQRNYYSPKDEIAIHDFKLKLWPGYFTSMRQHEHDILLNVDLQFKVLRTENVYQMLMECKSSPDGKRAFQNAIIGSIVLTGYNNRTYKIDDVDFNANAMTKFKKNDGTEVSMMDYYRDHHKINISTPNQPLLVTRAKPREIRGGMSETLYLIPELCQLTGLSDQQRENFNLMKQLAIYTRIGAADRIGKLMEFSKKLNSNPEIVNEIRKWDLSIANNLVEFPGRVLMNENLLGAGDAKYSAGPDADWTRELRSRPMFAHGEINRLAVITPARCHRQTETFMQTLEKAASSMRWTIGQFRIFQINDDRASSYLDQLEKVINSAKPSMVFVVLPNNSLDRYSAIKKKCYVDRGVPSQVILAKNLTHKNALSIATKIAIQMNCKMGGAPWSISIPLSTLMIVGYDVCRDTANKKKSFAGMVSSLDKSFTRYFNAVYEHKLEEELSDNIATFLILACKQYQKENGALPDRIAVYRDGVGEGQLPYVYEHEVKNIKRKLEELYGSPEKVKLAFIIVSKRINTRIFVDRKNPPPGTVVDDVITLPERYDFFIISQCVRQGTVSPTNYNVIEDTMGLTPDKLHILTYKLCHMYYNWSGTVRVPAPCQYAHKLAFLVSQSLHRPAHADLQTLLYYL